MNTNTKRKELHMPYNFSWLEEGTIAGMGCPRTSENLNYLTHVGINHIITLSPERRPPISEYAGVIKWSEIEIEEFEAPTLEQVLHFINLCIESQSKEEVRIDTNFFKL